MRNNCVSKAGTLTFREKLSRLGKRLREPRWRRYGMLMLAGRALGLVVLLALILGGPMLFHAASDLVNTSVHAQDAPPAAPPDPYKAITGGDIINPINTGWVLLGAFLVFGMQAGFTMLEAASRTMFPNASRTSSRFGGCCASQRLAASPNVMTAVIG